MRRSLRQPEKLVCACRSDRLQVTGGSVMPSEAARTTMSRMSLVEASPTPLLEGRHLARAYRLGATRVPALAGVDIRIARGDFVVLEGPSGSGKTTLINLLGLLDRPDEGTLALDGEPVAAMDDDARADVRRVRYGFVFQTFNLVPVLTAQENVEYPMALRGMDRRAQEEKARRLLASVGLSGKEAVRPDLLSGGERQRVAIARSVANDPEVVLADEP